MRGCGRRLLVCSLHRAVGCRPLTQRCPPCLAPSSSQGRRQGRQLPGPAQAATGGAGAARGARRRDSRCLAARRAGARAPRGAVLGAAGAVGPSERPRREPVAAARALVTVAERRRRSERGKPAGPCTSTCLIVPTTMLLSLTALTSWIEGCSTRHASRQVASGASRCAAAAEAAGIWPGRRGTAILFPRRHSTHLWAGRAGRTTRRAALTSPVPAKRRERDHPAVVGPHGLGLQPGSPARRPAASPGARRPARPGCSAQRAPHLLSECVCDRLCAPSSASNQPGPAAARPPAPRSGGSPDEPDGPRELQAAMCGPECDEAGCSPRCAPEASLREILASNK